MANNAGQVPAITETSVRQQADRLDEDGSQSSVSSALKLGETHAVAELAALTDDGDKEAGGMTRLERITTSFGDRPEYFRNTLQEVAFVMQATVATASTAFLMGTALIITVPVSLDLKMTQGEISWISASTSCVIPFSSFLFPIQGRVFAFFKYL